MVPPAERSTEAAREAWRFFWQIFAADKRRRWAIFSELGISPRQSMAIAALEPGDPMPMTALAEALHCDNSNITGIVDRLEAAGLAERRPDERDRRVKAVVLTERGEWMKGELDRRVGEPPPKIAALPAKDAIALRDILARALDGAPHVEGRSRARAVTGARDGARSSGTTRHRAGEGAG